MNADEAAIRQRIESWAEAVRRQDMDGILAGHAADMVMFDVPPPLALTGIDAYAASWPQFFESSPRPMSFEILNLDITAGVDVAFAVALMQCRTPENGVFVPLDFRLTIGLRKIGGEWIVTHEHHSVPAA